MVKLLLFYIAIILSVVIFPLGVLVRMFYPNVGEYLFRILISIDQLGNVVCDKLFDLTLVKGHYFGDEDETISSAMGRAKLNNDLTFTGRLLDSFLNLLDKNHTIKNIEKC
jgi:8-oxo-dGTP diphosphatase